MNPLQFQNYHQIVVLTGAGVSAASGLPTFRGPSGGLAQELLPVSDGRRVRELLPQMWQVYGRLRAGSIVAHPNAAHFALAKWQQVWQDKAQITLVTQNVDGLHTRAESEGVIEIHGSLLRSRCLNPTCPNATPFEDLAVPDEVPLCSICGDALRPDITLFNEPLPLEGLHHVKRALRFCDLFLAIGTSGTVAPSSEFVRSAFDAGARTIFINLTPLEIASPYFGETILGRAEELLPTLLGVS
ncbi:NAD-dependent protein deacylase [Abditibacteriota bacterium]|nr:NAD-dependent protein deacylase [Abditibacteriota bacterium]